MRVYIKLHYDKNFDILSSHISTSLAMFCVTHGNNFIQKYKIIIYNIYIEDCDNDYSSKKEKCKHLVDDWFICRWTLPAVLHRSPPQPS